MFLGHPKCVQLRSGGGGVTPYVYVRNLHYLFSCFWQHLCLLVSCFFLFFFLNNLTSVQKRCVRHKRLFFSNKINFRRHEISFFHLKLFLLSKLAKTLVILIKLKVRYALYFSMIPYFGKTLYSVGRK